MAIFRSRRSQYSFSSRQRPGRGAPRALLMLALLAGAAYGGYRYALIRHAGGAGQLAAQSPERSAQSERSAPLAASSTQFAGHLAENQGQSEQLARAEGEITIERSARKELEKQLLATQAELGQARDDTAFYEQLLPPGPAGVVSLRGIELTPRDNVLRYRVLVMRSTVVHTPPFSGTLQFVAEGRLNGRRQFEVLKPARIAANPDSATTADAAGAGTTSRDGTALASNTIAPAVSGTPAAVGLPLAFDRYQRSQGVLGLPESFTPDRVVVNVLQGRTVRSTRTVSLKFQGSPAQGSPVPIAVQ